MTDPDSAGSGSTDSTGSSSGAADSRTGSGSGSAGSAGSAADVAAEAVADAHRREWALVLAATVRVARDLDVAEECVQEAYASALASWPETGVPGNPAAWLTTTARRRAIDVVRRERTFRSKLPLLIDPEPEPTAETASPEEVVAMAYDEPAGADASAEAGADAGADARAEAGADAGADAGAGAGAAGSADIGDGVPDDRLRLIFTCCHPALSREAQVALTLRLVCGVSTPDTARALLVSQATMAARLTRAKKKIATARIPYRIPGAAELPDRLRAVLDVVHLVFTTGHTAPSGDALVRSDLVDRALHLARTLRTLMPDEPEVRGLLALILATDARRATRVDSAGRLLRLEDQDRTRWDRAAIAEAQALVIGELRTGRAGRYVLQAAIATAHAEAPSYDRTDWPAIVRFYDALLLAWPSPVVALNRAVAVSMADGPAVALRIVEELRRDERLRTYRYLPAVEADLLRRLDRPAEAARAYRRALELTSEGPERAFLTERLAQLGHLEP